VTPARSGAHPDLALAYDSGAGNSSFGLGFRQTTPQIWRDTDKALPTYDDDADTFMLSGVGELVPALLADGQLHRFEDGDEVVTRYRARMEGLFARIEHRRHKVTGIVHWKVTTRDNVTSLFGRSEASRIAAPGAPRRIASWLLEEVRDDRGNVSAYERAHQRSPVRRELVRAASRGSMAPARNRRGARDSDNAKRSAWSI
jgi:hypothetical protein